MGGGNDTLTKYQGRLVYPGMTATLDDHSVQPISYARRKNLDKSTSMRMNWTQAAIYKRRVSTQNDRVSHRYVWYIFIKIQLKYALYVYLYCVQSNDKGHLFDYSSEDNQSSCCCCPSFLRVWALVIKNLIKMKRNLR